MPHHLKYKTPARAPSRTTREELSFSLIVRPTIVSRIADAPSKS